MPAETKDKVIHKKADITDEATHLVRIMAETIISMSVICYRETFDKMEQDMGESPKAYFVRLKSKATACKLNTVPGSCRRAGCDSTGS